MGDVAYRDADFWTKGDSPSGAASTAWADANRTDMRLILAAWNEANKDAWKEATKDVWNQFSIALSDLHASQQQLRMELASMRAQLATKEMHKAVAEYGILMRREAPQVVVVRNFIDDVRIVRGDLQHKRLAPKAAAIREELEYKGVKALRPFRHAAGAAFLGALVAGIVLGWLGNRQTIEMVGAAVGLILWIIAHFASANAKSTATN